MTDDELRLVFDLIDTSKNGLIDADEFLEYVKTNGTTKFNLDMAKKFIDAGDEDGDGKIDMNEFKEIVRSGALKKILQA